MKYLIPIAIAFIATLLYLNLPFSTIEKKKLDLSVSYEIKEHINVSLQEDVDYGIIYRNALVRSMPFYQVIQHRRLSYVQHLTEICGTSTLSNDDKEILKDYSVLAGISELPQVNDKFDLYNNLAYLTIAVLVIILIIVFVKFNRYTFVKGLAYVFCLVCAIHILFAIQNKTLQKQLDITLKESYKSGCLK
ncbi:hypothetical protein [Flavobacterium sp. 3HN19-14]|uniref:hypothetical protein n=1 Tax=Flavobacterium sp. 3HN19-14 TaxID=3448133 RepID=UPI003EE19DD2